MDNTPRSNRSKFSKHLGVYAVILLVAFVAGYGLKAWRGGDTGAQQHAAVEADDDTIWTCSMHPQVRQPSPGLCPICAMDLIPETKGEGGENDTPRTFRTSDAARALMAIETAPAYRAVLHKEVSLVGRLAFDETRLAYITAWVPGRIERMFADYTGVQVAQGDHMVELFSPELIAAKEELERAASTLKRLPATTPNALQATAQTTRDAVAERLKRWGLSDAQIRQAESEGAKSDRITIFAPIGGTVIERNGREGMFVETGTQIYGIADMSTLWLMLDAYESDLPWIHYGQMITFTTEAMPGEVFEGQIAFIDPVLNEETRTVRVRVNVPNPEGRLKAGMFAKALVSSAITTGAKVVNPDMAGKWISPMHPEIIKDGPGSCDICGMALVPVEEYGYAGATPPSSELPVIVPASAPLVTGKRAVVYVALPDGEGRAFEGREVVLGPRGREGYMVLAGLEAGEEVVVHGNFKIDSALEIQARPSMMRPEEGLFEALEARLERLPEMFLDEWTKTFDAYLDLNEALASDDFSAAQAAVGRFSDRLAAVDASALEGARQARWTDERAPALRESSAALAGATDIEVMREALVAFSDAMVRAVDSFPVLGESPLYLMNCPMAGGDDGADWLQREEEMRNPYMGARMLVCGTVTREIAVENDAEAVEPEHVH